MDYFMGMNTSKIVHAPQWQDLRMLSMPRVCKLLECEAEKVCGVEIPQGHMPTKFRDHAIRRIPFADGMPDLADGPLHGEGSACYGITLYECRGARELKYVVCAFKGQYSPFRY